MAAPEHPHGVVIRREYDSNTGSGWIDIRPVESDEGQRPFGPGFTNGESWEKNWETVHCDGSITRRDKHGNWYEFKGQGKQVLGPGPSLAEYRPPRTDADDREDVDEDAAVHSTPDTTSDAVSETASVSAKDDRGEQDVDSGENKVEFG